MTSEHQGSPNESLHGRSFDLRRFWFPILVVGIGIASFVGTYYFASTNIQNTIGYGAVPILATLALLVWWMRRKELSIGERVGGVALFLFALGAIGFLNGRYALYVVIIALPVISAVALALILLTSRMKQSSRRAITAGGMILAVIIAAQARVDAVGGDLIPLFSSRWSPPPEQPVDGEANFNEPEPGRVAALPDAVGPNDWPEFRGPQRYSAVPDITFGTDWDAKPPREIWRRAVGLGWSSFCVVGDYFFTQEQRGDEELVACYQLSDGEPVWLNRVSSRFSEPMGDGPRGTPTYVDGKLYPQGATGELQCLEASTGKTIWKSDVGKDTGAKLPQWGFSSSPLVVDGRVVTFTGAGGGQSVIAYDAATGARAWAAGSGMKGYCSAQVAQFDDMPQVLMISDYGLQSFAPADGALIWEYEWEMTAFPRITQPCFTDADSIVIGTGFAPGSRKISIAKSDNTYTVSEDWTARKFRPYFNDFVHHEGALYGFNGNRITCADAETGEVLWAGDRIGGQVLLFPAMDMLLVLSERGEVWLIEATPEAHSEVARFDAIKGKTWNHPVVVGDALLVRNSGEMACYELPGA